MKIGSDNSKSFIDDAIIARAYNKSKNWLFCAREVLKKLKHNTLLVEMDSSEIKNAFHALTLMQLISRIEETLAGKDLNSREESEMQENIKKLMELYYERGPKSVKREIMKVLQNHKNHPNSKVQTVMFNSFKKFHEKYHHQVIAMQRATDEILQSGYDDNVIKKKMDEIQEAADNSEFEDMPKTAKACFNYIARQHGALDVREKAKTRAEKL